MSTTDACCTRPPTESAYQPQGTTEKIGGVDVYLVGPKDAKYGVVAVYDIFGLLPPTKQTVDLLSKHLHARVAMPDYFDGKPWPKENFPPKNGWDDFKKWVAEYPWEKLKPTTLAVVDNLKAGGVQAIGSLGFCWGALICGHMTADIPDVIRCAGMPHPSMLDKPLAEKAKAPWCLLPSKDEADMTDIEQVLKANKQWGDKVVVERFNDMPHGWCAARADYKDATFHKRAHDAIDILTRFYQSVL